MTMQLPLGSPGFWADPYPTWAALRAEDPVFFWDSAGAWVVLDHAHVVEVLRDDEGYSTSRLYWKHHVEVPFAERSLHDQIFESGLFNVDHDDHVRLRRLVTKAFTPRGVEEQRPYVEAQVDRLLSGRQAGDPFDVARDLANPLPARVIGHLLGVPEEDSGEFKRIADSMIRAIDPTLFEQVRDEIDRDAAELVAILDRTIEHVQATGADTLLSRLLAVEEQGDRLSRHELTSLVTTLLVAGSDTTVHAISLGALSLLQHPPALRRLLADPAGWEPAVSELLRFSFIGSGVVRYARTHRELGGHAIEPGDMVVLNLSAAHHDPAVFPDPTRLDLDRDNHAAVLFGLGTHYCVGAALARLEVATVLRRFFERFPATELEGEPTWGDHLVLRGLRSLPVRLATAPR